MAPPAGRWAAVHESLARAHFRLPRPTPVGWAASAASAMLLGLAWQRDDPLVLLAGAVVAAATAIGLAAPAFFVARVALFRVRAPRAVAGAPVELAWRVAAPGLAPLPVVVVDFAVPGAGGGGVARGAATAAPSRAAYRTRFRRRGRHHLGPCLIETDAPFGLARARVARHVPGDVLVLPRVRRVRLPTLPAPRGHVPGPRTGRSALGTDTDDFSALRDFRAGDSPRRIHWRTSARAGRLLVREFEAPAARRVTVALEGATGFAGRRGQARFERGVATAAGVCAALERAGHCYRLALPAPGAPVGPFGRGPAHLQAVLHRLAECGPSEDATADALAARLELARPGDAPVLWVRLLPGPCPAGPAGAVRVATRPPRGRA